MPVVACAGPMLTKITHNSSWGVVAGIYDKGGQVGCQASGGICTREFGTEGSLMYQTNFVLKFQFKKL